MKSEELLNDFTKYCREHPNERFWQALRNWSGAEYLVAVKNWTADDIAEIEGLDDTFYWEEKNK